MKNPLMRAGCIFCLFFVLCTTKICSQGKCCFYMPVFCSLVDQGYSAEKLALVKPISSGLLAPFMEYLEVAVIDDLFDNIPKDTIRLFSYGSYYGAPISATIIFDTVLIALTETEEFNQTVYVPNLCGSFFLVYHQDTLLSVNGIIIAPEIHKMAYQDFKSNLNYCIETPVYYRISGRITGWTDPQKGVPDLQFAINNFDGVSTDLSGYYDFDYVEMPEPWISVPVQPQSDNAAGEGITAQDLIKIQKHILANELLESPLQIIAADVNNSKSVTALDYILLKKMILGISQDFPNNHAWRFVDRSYTFPDPADPWSEEFPEAANIPDICGDILVKVNFLAIKTGDVDGSYFNN
ncbi:MAG TPA: dockerin type I domain-containing protein [Flavilitoribacter sp.]|nr:dockerin type I domain-containing protein [Flavilitoribacter sp.]HMQ86002.1 dockerin type I domain-containing protein [Flavilitoribacter sp.]